MLSSTIWFLYEGVPLRAVDAWYEKYHVYLFHSSCTFRLAAIVWDDMSLYESLLKAIKLVKLKHKI